MEILELILYILGAVIVSSFVSRFIPRISTPLVQIALGIAVTYLPMFPDVKLNPELFMVLFIAPLLYVEAHHIEKPLLYRTLKYSLPMAIGLAFGIMVIVGFILHAVMPDIPMGAAFALGAALGPTDAVAVSSMSKEASFTEEQQGVLEGESLLNDASGVVGFQFSILAAVTGTFSLATAAEDFIILFTGGAVMGVLAGMVTNWLFRMARRIGWETMTTRILVEIFLPFLVYLGTNNMIHVSGILAVVAFGLTVHFDRSGLGPNVARTNIVSTSVWSVVSFSLNGAVFILLGMQMPGVTHASWFSPNVSNTMLIGIILLVSVTATVLRFLWVWLIAVPSQSKETSKLLRKPRSLRDAAVMTFGGAKGTITLSLMFTIPYTVASGEVFPLRNELIFIASGVIIITLLLANFTLPLLAPNQDDDKLSAKLSEIDIEVMRLTVEELTNRVDSDNRRFILPVIDSYNSRITRLKRRMGSLDIEQFQTLQIDALHWEKEYVRDRLADAKLDTTMDEHVRSLEIEACERMLDQIMNTLRHSSSRKGHYRAVSQIRGRIRSMQRQITTASRRAINKVLRSAPLLEENEIYNYLHAVQIDAINHVIERLYREMNSDTYQSEYCSMLLRDYRRAKAQLRSRSEIATGAAQTMPRIEEVKHESYAIELGVIQNMLEAGDITRSEAKSLRRNVYVMQVDASSEI